VEGVISTLKHHYPGVEGVVQLQVRIRKDGAVEEVTTRSGHPLLVKAAIDAVKRYVYKPVLLNGTAVDVITTVDVPFKLEDSSADAIRNFR
jgi:outer membrane biosynthesis protein TonB